MNAELYRAGVYLPVLMLLTLPAAGQEKDTKDKKPATVRVVPRLLMPPASSAHTRMTWWNGESLRGELDTATAAAISWKSPLFELPVTVKQEFIRRIDYSGGFQRVEGNFRLALTDGSHLTGELEKLDADTVTFHAAACGAVTVKRDMVFTLERIGGEGILAAGPLAIVPDKGGTRTDAGNAGLQIKGGGRFDFDNAGNAGIPLFLAAAGRAASPGFNLASTRILDLPAKSMVDLMLLTEGTPDFKLLAATSQDYAGVETWGDELVLLLGKRFASAGNIFKDTDRMAHVRLAWDQTGGRAALYSSEGKLLAEIAPLHTPKKEDKPKPSGGWLRRLFGGEDPPAQINEQGNEQRQQPSKGVTLLNKGSGVVVERFAVSEWNGRAPPAAILNAACVETDSEIIAGEPASCRDGKLTLRIAAGGVREIPLSKVRAIRWQREIKSGRDTAQTDLWFSDGNLLRGKLTGVQDDKATMETAFSAAPVTTSLARCRAVILPEPAKKDDSATLAKFDMIRAGETVLHGTIQPQGGELPHFLPLGAEMALLPVAAADLTITRALAADEKFPRSPALLHVKSKETLPVTLQSVSREKIEFTWDAAEQHTLDIAQLHAVQFSAPAPDGKGFDGAGWRSLTDDGKGVTRKADAVVLQPGAGIGHPWLLQGSDIAFRMDQDGGGLAGIRVRLFCQGTGRESSLVNFLIGDFGGEIYCGLESTEGQFSSSSQVQGEGPANIRFTFNGDKIEMWVNKVKAVSTTIAAANANAGRGGKPGNGRAAKAVKTGDTGIIIESASLWGNQMSAVKLMDLSMDLSPCMAGPPAFSEEAKKEALLLPRLRREDPPRQVLIGRNGDLLRGEIEGITNTHLAFRSGLENFKVPLDRVAAAVWLIVPPRPEPKKDAPAPKKKDNEGDDGEILAPQTGDDSVFIVVKAPVVPGTAKKEKKPEPKKEKKKEDPRSAPKPGLQWLDLTNGGRLSLKVDSWTAESVTGQHPLLGKCIIPRNLVHHFTLKEPPPPAALSALSEWKLAPTPDPVPPEDDGKESPLAGKPAPEFKLPMLEGDDFDLSKAKGKVVVLDFWATWCGPCVKSLPGLIEAMAEFPSGEVMFVAVNQGESKDQVTKFLSARGWEMPVAFDADQKVAKKFSVEGIPHTVVIDRDGKIAFTKTGAAPDGAKKIAAAVQQALDAAPPEKKEEPKAEDKKEAPEDPNVPLLPAPKVQ